MTTAAADGFWSSRPVLLTGATGLVGSWVAKELLAASADLVVLVRNPDPQSEFYRSGDFRRTSIVLGQLQDFWALEQAVNEHAIDTVIHLGAQPIVGAAYRMPWQTFEANIRGTYNVLEACRIHSRLVKRVVIASSDKAYGQHEHLPYTEQTPLAGRHPYDVSKSCTDLLAQSYSATYGLPVAIARCGNIYGGGDLNWSRIVPGTVRSLLREERPILRSDGTFIRDYLYVRDAASAYLALARGVERPEVQGQAFNFSPERPVAVLELVERIRALMDARHLEPDIRNEARSEIQRQFLDSSRARQVLGWSPGYELDAGLRETIDWYRAYFGQ